MSAQAAMSLGVAGVARKGAVFAEAALSGGSRARTVWPTVADAPAFGLGSLGVGADAGRADGRTRVGGLLLVDVLAVDGAERDCLRQGCRYGTFVGSPGLPGAALQPAAAVRVVSGSGAGEREGVGWSFSVGSQPHVAYGVAWPLSPRIEGAIWDRRHGWVVHGQAGRFGAIAGVGVPLGRRGTPP